MSAPGFKSGLVAVSTAFLLSINEGKSQTNYPNELLGRYVTVGTPINGEGKDCVSPNDTFNISATQNSFQEMECWLKSITHIRKTASQDSGDEYIEALSTEDCGAVDNAYRLTVRWYYSKKRNLLIRQSEGVTWLENVPKKEKKEVRIKEYQVFEKCLK